MFLSKQINCIFVFLYVFMYNRMAGPFFLSEEDLNPHIAFLFCIYFFFFNLFFYDIKIKLKSKMEKKQRKNHTKNRHLISHRNVSIVLFRVVFFFNYFWFIRRQPFFYECLCCRQLNKIRQKIFYRPRLCRRKQLFCRQFAGVGCLLSCCPPSFLIPVWRDYMLLYIATNK